MGKKIAVVAVVAVFLALLSQGLVFAGETTYRFDPQSQSSRAMEYKNTWAGYKLYQSSCKSCHYRGNDKGASFLETDSRTMQGWNKVFYKKNVPCAKDGSWAKLSPEDLVVINDYLYTKAYDTWDPRSNKSCG
ncbi:hypothetical protein [Thiovibrio frasassiensis]|uniref:Cytochrome c domain-containing protein n=1 Tax=Thiovibrio frasassiensis TaxID=2984131 RepID=A0A9X4MIU6_9BACT|nr:hypothetical protein [Thiovibrio frasassiensis]MDG4476323.1 hypothetical protein [Thiovibrio frasassiensis]